MGKKYITVKISKELTDVIDKTREEMAKKFNIEVSRSKFVAMAVRDYIIKVSALMNDPELNREAENNNAKSEERRKKRFDNNYML